MDHLDQDLSDYYGLTPDATVQVKKNEESLRTPDGKPPKIGRRQGLSKSIAASPVVYTPVTLSESENYGARTGKGEALLRYNCGDSTGWSKPVEKTKWSVEILKGSASKKLVSDQRVMFQKTRDVALKMNSNIHELAMSVISENDLEGYESLKESSTEEAVYIGRIRGVGNGKLTATDICFEGTLESSNGHMVSLDLSKLEEYYFYPGQVVALGGCLSMGKFLAVNNVATPKPLPFSDVPLNISGTTGPLSILVAAGPFTPNDSLSFEAFDDLLQKIKELHPGLVILFGPFMDEAHPKLNEFLDKQENLFEDFFRKKIQELCSLDLAGTQFVIVSSSKDVHHLPVFPTRPYDLSNADNSIIHINQEVITSVPDPCTISVNGVIIGLTSTDILMHMSQSTLARSVIKTNPLARIAKELLSQRNFYPLYPPHESVQLDVNLWTEYSHMSFTPHILILPSQFDGFIKDVDKTVVVNPGRLSAGKRTYARLHVDIPEEEPMNSPSSIADFAMGEIVKI